MKYIVFILMLIVVYFFPQKIFASEVTSVYVTQPIIGVKCVCISYQSDINQHKEVDNEYCDNIENHLYKCSVPHKNDSHLLKNKMRQIFIAGSTLYVVFHPSNYRLPFYLGYILQFVAPWIYS